MPESLPKRADNFAEWYNRLVQEADLAEHSAVRGCMVIKPYGFGIWENMQHRLDTMFKETGHTNAYFPLFIPKSFLSREAEHVEGFAKECAVVTHHRLTKDPDGNGIVVDPEARLEEELIVRPTSETIIWNTYRDWIQSYRDLPILVNQWANVVRWEMRTRLFLRTAEFLWQEGHTAHATREEAIEETEKMLNVYGEFAEHYMAMPVVKGTKTASERFAGAEETYCIESLMQDGKALQAGTSHFLGQNFAKAFDVTFLNQNNEQAHVWATSWGVSTRLMGALILTHSDDQGLVVPPRLAPVQVVVVPIAKNEQQLKAALGHLDPIVRDLRGLGIRVKIDDDPTKRPGWKFAEWELKGVPVRLVAGAKDIEKGQVEIARRDTSEKQYVAVAEASNTIGTLLTDIQHDLFLAAKARQDANTHYPESWEAFVAAIEDGGFVTRIGTARRRRRRKSKRRRKPPSAAFRKMRRRNTARASSPASRPLGKCCSPGLIDSGKGKAQMSFQRMSRTARTADGNKAAVRSCGEENTPAHVRYLLRLSNIRYSAVAIIARRNCM
jgi:prolyl-tRNA synthetase